MALPKITPELVTEIFRKSGPLLPVELAKRLGVDSFIAKAFLSQMVEANQVRITQERVGNEFLYFIPGQESSANAKLQTFPKNKIEVTPATYAPAPSATPAQSKYSQLEQNKTLLGKQEQFMQRLQDIESREVRDKRMNTVLPITVEDVRSLFVEKPVAVGGEILSKLKSKVPADIVESGIEELEDDIEEIPRAKLLQRDLLEKPSKKSTAKTKTKENIDGGNCVIQAIGYLTGIGGNIISKEMIRKGKDAEIIVELDSAVGPMKMLAVIRDKKTINDADLNVAYNAGLDKKMPVLFLTRGKLTKKAEEYHSGISSLTIKHIGE
jgi:hypothetical protein